jgi:DNA-3-methyladenine glycosylase II
MATLGEAWRPYRGAAAHLLWAYYRVAKNAGFNAAPPDADAETAARSDTKTRRARPAWRKTSKRPVRAKSKARIAKPGKNNGR